jgi:hypothetical protein
MNTAVVGILLLLIAGLAGAFLYIRKLRAKSDESAKKLQVATSEVSSLQSSLKDVKSEVEASTQKLEEEKKVKKAELTRIAADRKAEKARRDALEKMKNAKIAELSAKQKRHEAEIAKTEARRRAALKEADAARAKAKAARTEANTAITNAKRSKQLADNAKRIADQRARRAGIEISRAKTQQSRAAKDAAMARQRVARAAKDVASAKAQVRGVNIKRTFEDAARYNAVPGYYTSGHKWAGDQFNVSDPNVCRSIAQKKRLAVWGHRNSLHPNKKYKNSCYFYHSGPKYAGNGNDRIHMIGCAFGGNPRTGCSAPKRLFGKRLVKGVKRVPSTPKISVRRGKKTPQSFQNAARYNAVPGYFRSGFKFAGDQFNVSDPNVCKRIAQQKRVAVWGHRNSLHGNKKYKNSCYFYHSGPKYAGDGNDRIHMIGCAFGGNPRTGCSAPKRVFGKKLVKGVKKTQGSLQNRRYGLLGGRNKKWCADENHKGRITCNRGGIGGWERFTVHNLGNNQVALKGGRNGKWCADEGNRVVCNRNGIGGWERFTVKNLGNNEFALKGGRNGKWCADEGGRIICNRGGIGAWEKFKFKPV